MERELCNKCGENEEIADWGVCSDCFDIVVEEIKDSIDFDNE